MDGTLTTMLGQQVSIEPWSAQDAYAKPTYGASVDYRAQVTHCQKMVRRDNGQEAIATTQVILDGSPTVSTKDRITLPSGFTPATPPILSVEKFPDEGGTVSVTVLYCGGGA